MFKYTLPSIKHSQFEYTMTIIRSLLLAIFVCGCGRPAVPPQVEYESTKPKEEPSKEEVDPQPREQVIDLGLQRDNSGLETLKNDDKPFARRDTTCTSHDDCGELPQMPKRGWECYRNKCVQRSEHSLGDDWTCSKASHCSKRGLNRPKSPGTWACKKKWCVFERSR